MRRRLSAILFVLIALALTVPTVFGSTVFFQGFEEDTDGWAGAIRVSSGTNGIPSATGDYHAETDPDNPSAFTQWGGYSSEFPDGGYGTAIDIYLDVEAGYDNDTRFDFSSAVNNPAGNHRRDFIFNAGFYDDATGPGAGTERFVISASNNAGRGDSFPKNPDRDPIAVTDTGWYTFTHHFYDGGGGVLAVDLNISDADGNVLATWTLSNPTDIIGDTVGGNRYGWFASVEMPFLAFDNSELTAEFTVTDPETRADCVQGGWEDYGFRNQGDCVSFVNAAPQASDPGRGQRR